MHSPDDLAAAAEKFTAAMDGHKIFAFYGSMGAGKTTFIRAVCKALGVTEEVKINEVYDLGYEDYFYGGGTCFIEWPELVEDLLPADAVKVRIDALPDGTRKITF